MHFAVMGDAWQQNGEGVAALIASLPGTLTSMLGQGAPLPRVIVSDRGPSFYQASTGRIVGAYKDALKLHGFRAYAGDDANGQPPDIPDALPHETAAGWRRSYMKKHPLQKGKGIAAMEQQLRERLGDCAAHINANYDVDGVCRAFPARLQEVVVAGGERLGQ